MSIGSPWSRNAALWLTRLGHEVHVVDFFEKKHTSGYLVATSPCQAAAIEAFTSKMASIHRITSRAPSKLRYVFGALSLRRITRQCRAEIVLSLYSGGFMLMAYLSGFRPYATYAVGSDVLLIRGLNRWLSRHILTTAKAVLSNGYYLAEQTRKLAPNANVVPLLFGVDVEKFSPDSPPAAPLRLVCTRGFESLYNNDYLIRGLALLPEGLPEFRVTFVSPGPLLPYVRDLADKLLSPAMRRRVEFLGGVPEAELPAILRSSHVYVSLSRSDGTATSTLEALACGLYPVLSAIPQNREWIDRTSPNGLLVPLDQPQKLADALAAAITGQERRLRAVLQNRQLILERADSSQTMKTLASILESTIETHRR
jgi:glycosyltransferase involved in cell wall biosynthesis